MSVGSIYKIEFPNGKHYIGLTSRSLEDRKKEHTYCAKSDDTKCLYKALRKYEMVDTFELVEIDTADTLEELCEKEIGYIQVYNSYYMDGNGYNMTLGGEGINGYVYTEEDKQKMSEMCKKYWENPEARKEHSEKRKNYFKNNPEAGKEQGEKIKLHYENNPEAIEKAREKSTKQWENPEARQQMSERAKQYNKDHPEARERMSKIKKQYFQDHPVDRAKILDARGKNKPFDIYTKEGTFIKTFNYIFEAKEYLQKEHNITSIISIYQVLNGNRNSSAGFVFKYKE